MFDISSIDYCSYGQFSFKLESFELFLELSNTVIQVNEKCVFCSLLLQVSAFIF